MAVSIDLGHVWVLESGSMALGVLLPAPTPPALNQTKKASALQSGGECIRLASVMAGKQL